MNVEKDYEELLRLFNKYKVKYCIVGAFAVAFHSKPRYTKDIDLLVEPTIENGKRIIAALDEFGFGKLGLTEKDFAREKQIIQLGYEPVRVDIVTSITGCPFVNVWKSKIAGQYGSQRVFFIGHEELIKNKKSTDRGLDKLDLATLRTFKKAKKL